MAGAADKSAPSPNVRNEHENSALKNDSSMLNLPQKNEKVNNLHHPLKFDFNNSQIYNDICNNKNYNVGQQKWELKRVLTFLRFYAVSYPDAYTSVTLGV